MRNRRSSPLRAQRPGAPQEIKSQLALELVLNGYAIGGSLVIFRSLLKALGVKSDRWVGSAIYGITDLIARPLTLLPGSDAKLVGDLTLSDATLVALVILFPLGLLVFGNFRASR
jgi:hypothetical protein